MAPDKIDWGPHGVHAGVSANKQARRWRKLRRRMAVWLRLQAREANAA